MASSFKQHAFNSQEALRLMCYHLKFIQYIAHTNISFDPHTSDIEGLDFTNTEDNNDNDDLFLSSASCGTSPVNSGNDSDKVVYELDTDGSDKMEEAKEPAESAQVGKIMGLATHTGHGYGLGFSHPSETLTCRVGSVSLYRIFSLSLSLTILHLHCFQLFLQRRSINADSCKLPSKPCGPCILSISVSLPWERSTNQQLAKACSTPLRFSFQPFNFPSLDDIEATHLTHPSSTRLCMHFFPFHLT
jgi:hypothetical protein